MESQLSRPADHQRYPTETLAVIMMTSNPYAPPSVLRETRPNRRWYRRLASSAANRFSALYVAGSIVGVISGVSYRAGVSIAFRDIATVNGIIFFAFFALLATVASVIFCPNTRCPRFQLLRLSGGFSFGLACLLIEPLINRLSRSNPDLIASPGVGFVLTLALGFSVSVVVQMLFTLGVRSSAKLANLPDGG